MSQAADFTFYLGVHQPDWMARVDVPLFVSHARLCDYRTLPVALGDWALDSVGFTELSTHGQWTISEATYAAAIQRYQREVGRLVWASPQDWMCEEDVLQATGLSVKEHQRRTVRSVISLRDRLGSDLVIPVLQGYQLHEYLECCELYARAGVDLEREKIVGFGSGCRRQKMREGTQIVNALPRTIALHGFGFSLAGLKRGARLASSDSMAWSYGARWRGVMTHGCAHRSRDGTKLTDCRNCLQGALAYRERVLTTLAEKRAHGPLFAKCRAIPGPR